MRVEGCRFGEQSRKGGAAESIPQTLLPQSSATALLNPDPQSLNHEPRTLNPRHHTRIPKSHQLRNGVAAEIFGCKAATLSSPPLCPYGIAFQQYRRYPLCPYGITFRRACKISTAGSLKQSICSPLLEWGFDEGRRGRVERDSRLFFFRTLAENR